VRGAADDGDELVEVEVVEGVVEVEVVVGEAVEEEELAWAWGTCAVGVGVEDVVAVGVMLSRVSMDDTSVPRDCAI
jgi:hypothetical protein